MKRLYQIIALFLLFLFTGGTVYAKDGELDLKTDSMTQKKQRSQGNEIEHMYAPNLFMDRIEQEAIKSKTDAQEMLKTANRANFSKAEILSGDGLDFKAYRQALFKNYQVSDSIIVDKEESGDMMIWTVFGAISFVTIMLLIGIYLGRNFHGGRIFKRNH